MAKIPVYDAVRIIPREPDYLDRKTGSRGEIFYDRDDNTLRLFDGDTPGGYDLAKADLSNITDDEFKAKAEQSGIIAAPTVDADPPSSPNLGELWFDTDTALLYLYYDDGDSQQWVQPANVTVGSGGGGGGANLTVSSTAPVSPTSGSMWFNLDNGSFYVYVNDGDSLQWIQPSTPTPQVPTVLTDLGISDGTDGQVLTTDGSGNFSFTTIEGGGGGGGNLEGLTNVTLSSVTTGQVLKFNGTVWVNDDDSTSAGIQLTDISVGAEASASGNGGIAYNDSTGVFTYTPPDLSGYATTSALTSATSNSTNWDTAYGWGDHSTEGYLTAESDTLQTVTSRGATTTSSITVAGIEAGSGNITTTGTISADEYVSTGSGTPTFTSASTITFTATDGVFFNNLARFSEAIRNITGATGTVTHNTELATVFYHTSVASNFTANFTNVPTDNDRAIGIALILIQGATPYIPNSVQVNGVSSSINWLGGVTPSGNATQKDVVSFTLIRSSSAWTVLGTLNTFN